MKDLLKLIIADEELSLEDKSNLIEKIISASHGQDRFVTPGFYLHTDKNAAGELDMQLWYRNVDENGMTDQGPTYYNADIIVEMMKKEYLSQKGKTK